MLDRLLQSRGFMPMQRCLCIGTVEGEPGYAKHVKKTASKIARSLGGMSLTGYATRQWEHGRYSDVHMREDPLDYNIIIDTQPNGEAPADVQTAYERPRRG